MKLKLYTDYLVHLATCLITGDIPKPLPDDIDLEKFYKFAEFHKMENILYPALLKTGAKYDADVMKYIHGLYYRGVIVDTKQLDSYKKIVKAFEENQIKYVPMKGIILKNLFPSTDLRLSSDIDIMIYKEDEEKVKEIMEGLGYTTLIYGETNHDNYEKGKIIHIEMHLSLMPPRHPWKDVCNSIEASLVKADGYNYQYKMTDEDFYVYMIIHMAKHIKISGVGIRYVWDIWVYKRMMRDKLDFEKIKQRLEEAKLTEFDELINKLARRWFEGDKLNEITLNKLEHFFITSGWIGTRDREISANVAEMTDAEFKKEKQSYYTNIVCLPLEKMKPKYPVLEKAPFLLPIFWGVRITDILLHKKSKIKEVQNHFDGSGVEAGKALNEFKKEIGVLH